MSSLKDVAKRAGVSATTVSRVLNGNYYVTEETRTKVLEAVSTLNYKPNAIAQSLRNSKTDTIGILVPDVSNPYFMRLVRAFEEYSRRSGYNILLGSSDENLSKEQEMLSILETRTDSVVLATSSSYCQGSLPQLDHYRIPVVLIDREVSALAVPSVVEENERSTYELIQHLIQLGHRKIAMINSSASISTVVLRQQGYENALRDSGLDVNPDLIIRGRFDEHTGYASCKRLLDGNRERPTAIFCANNSITVGALIAIKEMGLVVPNDISLVSFGEIPFSQLISPRITAVVQDPEGVGTSTAQIVLGKLTNEESVIDNRLVLPTQIRLGASVHPLIFN